LDAEVLLFGSGEGGKRAEGKKTEKEGVEKSPLE